MNELNLLNLISQDRLSWYIGNNSLKDGLEKYNYDCLISAELYKIIYHFETIFRNFCYNTIKDISLNEKWYLDDNILQKIVRKRRQKKKSKISNTIEYDDFDVKGTFSQILKRYNAKRQVVENNIGILSYSNFIVNTDFSFWTELFCRERASKLYNKYFNNIFGRHNLKRLDISAMLSNIRFVRNKISHHHNILKYSKKYEKSYNDMYILFDIISANIRGVIKIVDNFNLINNNYKNNIPLK
jgi:hypothetical protein